MSEEPVLSKTVDQNEIFRIELSASPTTGYRWEVSFEEEFIQLLDRRFQRVGGGRIGGRGTEIFQFRAIESGETQMVFQYKRAWEQRALEERIYAIVISKTEG